MTWIVFFDSNDVLTQFKLSQKEKELKNMKEFYETKIEEVKEDQEALLNSDELLEKLAREKYLMKKENEDVFVLVEE
jgi:cell division protein FtsB